MNPSTIKKARVIEYLENSGSVQKASENKTLSGKQQHSSNGKNMNDFLKENQNQQPTSAVFNFDDPMLRKNEGKSLLGLEENFDLHAEEFLKLK